MIKKLKLIFSSSILITIKRGISLSISNIMRNKLFTLSTILVISIILFILNVTVSLNISTSKKLDEFQQKVDIIVYLKDDADLMRIKGLEDSLKNMPEVKNVAYTSKEEAMKKFLKSFPKDYDPFERYVISNPLPSDLTIITDKAENHQIVINFLKQGEYSDLLTQVHESDVVNEQITNNLISITRSIENFLFWLIVTFSISTILIIINSIHLTIYSRRDDIQVMKLVGARPLFIKLPFIFEGMIYGLVASLVSIGTIIIMSQTLDPSNFFVDISIIKTPLYIGVEVMGGLIIGLLSAWIATNLHFRKNITA
ncbi:ABC transporter permease [Patescibacteria group bacterium]|nr:ABC transporter permease [Patescibacteria group bacterium]